MIEERDRFVGIGAGAEAGVETEKSTALGIEEL